MSSDVRMRVDEHIARWRVAVDHITETESSVLAFGQRDNCPVVLKVVRHRGEEWRSGEILDAFDGNGVVRVYDYVEGAVLLEHLRPGTPLSGVAVSGADDEATTVLAEVIARMAPRSPPQSVATVQDWGNGFVRYIANRDSSIPRHLVLEAHSVYAALCSSQPATRLLHGDLHHDNVLFDRERGWVAIDPKGVVGELEYEIGAALRNPYEHLGAFANVASIERRVEAFRRRLGLDVDRTLRWGFAQAVLAAVWAIEDGVAMGPENAWIAFANAIRPMIKA